MSCPLASECFGCPISLLITPSLLVSSQFPFFFGHELSLGTFVIASFIWLEAESSDDTMDFEPRSFIQVCISLTLSIARTSLFLEILTLYYQRGVPGLIYIALRDIDMWQQVVNEHRSALGVWSNPTSRQLCEHWGDSIYTRDQVLSDSIHIEQIHNKSSNLC